MTKLTTHALDTYSGKPAKGMRVDWRKALAASRNHYFGYQYKPVASLEAFEKKQLRDLYIREVIFNINDKVHYVKEDIHGKIVRRSTNYIVLEDSEENLHKAWIYDCVPDSADKEVAVREFNLDVDYGFEAVSEGDMKEKKRSIETINIFFESIFNFFLKK